MVNPLFLALWLLCAFGAAVFAASFRQSWYTRAVLCLSFLASATWLSPGRMLDPVWIGALTAGVALWILIKPESALLAAFGSGALAGTLSALLQVQAMPRAAAYVISASLLLTSVILASGRVDFTSLPMREAALPMVAVMGLLIAAVPAIAAGWQSALSLNIGEKSGASPTIPAWIIMLGCVSAAAGMLSVLFRWRNR